MRRRLITGLFLGCLTGAVLGAPKGAVVRVEGEVVTVNRGEQDQVKRGDHWSIFHGGQLAAELQVEQVGEYSSLARITKRVGTSPVVAGDLVSPGGDSPTPPVAAGIPATGGPPTEVASSQPTQLPLTATPGMARPPSTTDLKELESRYKDRYESRTQSRDFTQTAGAPRSYNQITPGIDMMNLYSNVDLVLSSFGPGGFYGDPGRLLMIAGQQYYASRARDRLYDAIDAKVEIQATYWDEGLMEAYADYTAVSEGKGSPERMVQIKNSLYTQKGVARNRVFEVRLRNTGKVNAQLSPFHWHCFMPGPGGSLVKPERYDQVLDRTLSPGQEVTGNVYFPNAELQSGKVTLLFEDIFGDKGQLEFDTAR